MRNNQEIKDRFALRANNCKWAPHWKLTRVLEKMLTKFNEKDEGNE